MPPDSLTVTAYLSQINRSLRDQPGRIIGEVSQLQMYPGRTYLFFSLKDGQSGAMMKCIMWKRDYQLSGVELEDGMEVIVTGFAEIYPATGSLTFKAQTLELVGEGALKKAYDVLKDKLNAEGVFAEEKKRKIPSFVRNIGVITSKDGAVINDFLTNIGRHGFKISLIDSRVEGQLATAELIASVKSFRSKAERGDIEALVIIRGGGSLESLLPFNNEMLVREVAAFPVPVIAGIGHDKDVTLVAMAADCMVSTPTAVTAVLNESWDRAASCVELWENNIFSSYRDALYRAQSSVTDLMSDIKQYFQDILERFSKIEFRIKEEFNSMRHRLQDTSQQAVHYRNLITDKFSHMLKTAATSVETSQKQLSINDPARLLRLGYSIARGAEGRVLTSATQAKEGSQITVRLKDGEIEAEVQKVR